MLLINTEKIIIDMTFKQRLGLGLLIIACTNLNIYDWYLGPFIFISIILLFSPGPYDK